MDNETVVQKLTGIRSEICDYLDTGYKADEEISAVICGKIDELITEIVN
jgi:hypothetical protein